MIAFVQPFSIAGKAGGSRILRTLVDEPQQEWVSICTGVGRPENVGDKEVWIPARPIVRPIDQFVRLQRLITSNLELMYGGSLERRLVEYCTKANVTAIHAIPHGIDFWYAFKAARKMGVKYYLNVHDELFYNLNGVVYLPYAMKRLKQVWAEADEVFVISEAMGKEYSRRYGHRDYVVVTDGLTQVAPSPAQRRPGRLRVYMMGSAHISYKENFQVLLEGLDKIKREHPDLEVTLTMRGGFPFRNHSETEVTELPWGTQKDVENDLQHADVLYLPLPFPEKFAPLARFSLATKLVTYLGTGLPILYHGPAYAAAAALLAEHDAALLVDQNDRDLLVDTLLHAASNSQSIVVNALELARTQFMVDDQRRKFWSKIAVPSV
ncbi:MAG: hypothetical protein HKN13_05140 [Rhodothermales bacterium]|nr:hypothetical protein [Rhodothermales bacterium]